MSNIRADYVFGELMTYDMICARYGCSKLYVKSLSCNYGYRLEEIVERFEYEKTFGRPYRKSKEYNIYGMLLSVREIAEFFGIARSRFVNYCQIHGVSVKQAFDHFYSLKHGEFKKRITNSERIERRRERQRNYYHSNREHRSEIMRRYYQKKRSVNAHE